VVDDFSLSGRKSLILVGVGQKAGIANLRWAAAILSATAIVSALPTQSDMIRIIAILSYSQNESAVFIHSLRLSNTSKIFKTDAKKSIYLQRVSVPKSVKKSYFMNSTFTLCSGFG
jgi:hypothetical protein